MVQNILSIKVNRWPTSPSRPGRVKGHPFLKMFMPNNKGKEKFRPFLNVQEGL